MSFTPEALNCPNCGGPLERFNPRSKTLSCPHCHSYIEMRRGAATAKGTGPPPTTRLLLDLGQEGTLEGEAVRVVGYIQYTYAGGSWEEYLILGEGGRTLWLSLDEGSLKLLESFTPTEEIDIQSIRTSFRLDGRVQHVVDRGRARISCIAGELTWAAAVGEEVRWVDTREVSIEFSEREVEFYRQRAVTPAWLRGIFGRINYTPRPKRDEEGTEAPESEEMAKWVPLLIILGVILFFLILVPALTGANRTAAVVGGHFSAGRSTFGIGK